jgi:hypothetical protein
MANDYAWMYDNPFLPGDYWVCPECGAFVPNMSNDFEAELMVESHENIVHDIGEPLRLIDWDAHNPP